MKVVGVREAYEDLANAIIKLAVDDYRSALLHLKRNPDSESAKQAVQRMERFFYSEWYEVLTNLDASYLLRKVREMIDNEE